MRYKIWNALGFGRKINSASDLTPKWLRESVKSAIRANPEEFDMGVFDCGTAACIAGHAWRIIREHPGDELSRETIFITIPERMGVSADAFFCFYWPKHLYKKYHEGSKVEAACEAIGHFTLGRKK